MPLESPWKIDYTTKVGNSLIIHVSAPLSSLVNANVDEILNTWKETTKELVNEHDVNISLELTEQDNKAELIITVDYNGKNGKDEKIVYDKNLKDMPLFTP